MWRRLEKYVRQVSSPMLLYAPPPVINICLLYCVKYSRGTKIGHTIRDTQQSYKPLSDTCCWRSSKLENVYSTSIAKKKILLIVYENFQKKKHRFIFSLEQLSANLTKSYFNWDTDRSKENINVSSVLSRLKPWIYIYV